MDKLKASRQLYNKKVFYNNFYQSSFLYLVCSKILHIVMEDTFWTLFIQMTAAVLLSLQATLLK